MKPKAIGLLENPVGTREWAGAKIVGPFFFKDFPLGSMGLVYLPTFAAKMNLMIGE